MDECSLQTFHGKNLNDSEDIQGKVADAAKINIFNTNEQIICLSKTSRNESDI